MVAIHVHALMRCLGGTIVLQYGKPPFVDVVHLVTSSLLFYDFFFCFYVHKGNKVRAICRKLD